LAISIEPTNPPCSFETILVSAPKLRINPTRSWLIQSGMKIVQGWPSARPIPANEIPVFPLVASTIGAPGGNISRS
jgi:hypothetical protein